MSNRFYSQAEINFLRENIDKFGVELCADRLGRTQTSVKNQCYRSIGHCCYVCNATKEEIDKLEFKHKFKPLDINFVSTEHPKELAYFLGYFWADGYIRGDGCLIMEINKYDADDIEHILMNLAEFKTYERIRPNRKIQKTFFYKDYENKVINGLKLLGKYSKSVESHEKILKYIPDKYIKYFLRGLLDGDGCLYVSPQNSKNHSTQISIAGRSEQDWNYIVNFIKEKYDLNFKNTLREYKTYRSSIIRATNKHKICNFLRNIYDIDDGIYLTRKFLKIKNLITNK